MEIVIAARHVDVSDSLRAVVEERFSRLTKFEPRVSRAEIMLLEERNRCEVEARASVDGAGLVHARAVAPDFRTAVDRTVDRLGRQLRRIHARRRNHRGVPKEERLRGGARIEREQDGMADAPEEVEP